MKGNFEAEFMEIQEGLISLCLEVTEDNVDKVFAYASIEKKSLMFNAFFAKGNNILFASEICDDDKMVKDFLKLGTMDLKKIVKVCKKNKKEIPTEIKMYYDLHTGKFDADYKYNKGELLKKEVSAETSFTEWYDEVKKGI